MEIINPADKLLIQLLGKQNNYSEYHIRPLKWTLKLKVEDGILFHNYITGESIFFEKESEIAAESKYLYSRYFFVPEDHDDLKLVEELRSAVRLIDRKEEITSYKILTTTDCNARCSYCYELGMKRENMSLETAAALVDYIKKKSGGKKVTLSWFGGEPLLNTEVIDHICTEIQKSGIEYSSVMISNGYLFTPEMVLRAGNKWNLKNIQITLDGTGDNYNRIKAYAVAEDDPYKRVMNNIESLTSSGIHVNIRLNVSLENYDDICLLSDDLAKRFTGNEYLSVYASGLFQDMSDESDPLSRKELFIKLGYITEYLHKKGLAQRSRKSLKLRVRSCMADGDSHRGISPSGMLMKCEHHIFDKLSGDIFSDKEDLNVLEEWKQRMPYGDICNDCFALPACCKLKNCPTSHVCTEEEKKQYTDSFMFALEEQYVLYKTGKMFIHDDE